MVVTSKELRPDRSLLDPDFNGYKLSLAPIPVYSAKITEGVDVAVPSDSQFSFLHQREFALHNHIHADPWNDGILYIVCKNWKVLRVAVNDEVSGFQEVFEVWTIPPKEEEAPGRFNVTIKFPSETLAVVSDGYGFINILETPPRNTAQPWKMITSIRALEGPFTLVDSRLCDGAPRSIHCLVVHIQPVQDGVVTTHSDRKHPGYKSVVQWIVLTEGSGSWGMSNILQLNGTGGVDYLCLEPSCKGLYLVGQCEFSDPSSKSAVPDVEMTEENQKPDYEWEQGFEEIKLSFTFEDWVQKSDFTIKVTDEDLKVLHQDAVILDGPFFDKVDSGLTTWSVKDKRLEVSLYKRGKDLWKHFVQSTKKGKETVNEEVVAEVHKKLAHLCSETEDAGGSTTLNTGQLEECDAYDGEARTMWRYVESGEVSHKISLGSQQWILSTMTNPREVPCFCLRFDVDGCVWQPNEPPKSAGEEWRCNHIGTFHAFGYILASKSNKKFVVTPQDMSYISVIDVTGHVIIYKKGITVSTSLRNRKTGQKVDKIATQCMVNLHSTGQILGSYASPSHIFVLTDNSVYSLAVDSV